MLDQAKQQMQKAIEHLRADLVQIRTGRATPALLENLTVEVYSGGQKLTIRELGAISAPEPSRLTVSPWDKTIIEEIATGIAKANIGLNPVVDGDLIRIKIPPLTEERRKELIRQLHQQLEVYRVEIRQIRHEVLEDLRSKKNSAEIGEDEAKRIEKQLQELISEFAEEIDLLGEAKEKELMQV